MRPELGRAKDAVGIKLIRALSARGIPLGTVETAQLPGLFAAAADAARGSRFYGPSSPGHLGSPPAEQELCSRLRGTEDARRMWNASEELTKVSFPAARRGVEG